MATSNLIEKSIGYGEIIISVENTDAEVVLQTLYTIEDDAYYYIYCPQISSFAYGNDISSAQENIVDAISTNFNLLAKEDRAEDLFKFPLGDEYLLAIEELKRNQNKKNIFLIAKYHFNPEDTEILSVPKKGPQLYEITKQIQMKVYSIQIDNIKNTA
ncbi:hypothetical protein LEP1GSC163_0193 [Leptospira santarosai str. CBC379]|uniref:hypothetical protein n=1 Tax=Leptospira santarosai TaxID=28183 RepID=UPI00029809E5|nr:hypothetical protein [Leptospira santarosai]EKR89747.1 hypothetical protein LEP1GSC163_0193 [Leptospira santarosai str. CBC379]